VTDPPADNNLIEKSIAAVVAFVISQIPPVEEIIRTGYDPFTPYQPGIYHSSDKWYLYLLIPAIVSALAIYLVQTSFRAFVYLIFAVISICLYRYIPVQSDLHFWNWILWHCVVAIFIAIVLHIYLHFRGLGP
jgi:hypothetical protein